MKSLDVRLYEAWKHRRGIRLSARDVQTLLFDEALQTRIGNAIAFEHGCAESGHAEPSLWAAGGSITKFLSQCERAADD